METYHIKMVCLLIFVFSCLGGSVYAMGSELHDAASRGDSRRVRTLLVRGANVNELSCSGETPLFHASLWGHRDVVELLVDNGADVNALGGYGDVTPLFHASLRGRKDVVALLLERGADLVVLSKYGNSVVDMVDGAKYPELKQLLRDTITRWRRAVIWIMMGRTGKREKVKENGEVEELPPLPQLPAEIRERILFEADPVLKRQVTAHRQAVARASAAAAEATR